MFNVLLLGINYKKKICSIFQTKTATVFHLAKYTNLLDTENAKESFEGSYRTISVTMEVICKLLYLK